MELEFDPDKDAINIVKHGVSLTRAGEMQLLTRVSDGRFAEPRFRGYGILDGLPYCLVFTIRGDRIRAISFRRAGLKEFRRHVPA